MTFLLMPNENIHDSWSSENETWSETREKYHDLSSVKAFVLECVEKNPLSPKTEEKCVNQLQSTCSNVFWYEFMEGVTTNLPKALSFEETTVERMKKEFEWVMS